MEGCLGAEEPNPSLSAITSKFLFCLLFIYIVILQFQNAKKIVEANFFIKEYQNVKKQKYKI